MFNNKKSVLTKPIVVLREMGDKISVDRLGIWEHREKLGQITNLNTNFGLTPTIIKSLYENDFVWIIDQDFIKRFKYTASVRKPSLDNSYPVVWEFKNEPIIYVGDIPEQVLDRMSKAIDLGINYFTIHSMEPLPIKQLFTDPVLVGWVNNPCITTCPDFPWPHSINN